MGEGGDGYGACSGPLPDSAGAPMPDSRGGTVTGLGCSTDGLCPAARGARWNQKPTWAPESSGRVTQTDETLLFLNKSRVSLSIFFPSSAISGTFSIKKSILLANLNSPCHDLSAFSLLTTVLRVQEKKPHRTDFENKAFISSTITRTMKSPDSGVSHPGFESRMLLCH